MKTLTPALLQSAIAGLTDGLGGSIKAKYPTKTNPSSGMFGVSASRSNL